MPTHDTGVWLNDTGEVVYEPPEGRGTLLVAKGGEVSNAARSRLEALGATDTLPDATPAQETAAEADAVKSEDLQPKKAPAKRTRKSST